MSKQLATQTTQLPAARTGADDLFKKVAKSSDFLPRLQLFSKGKAVNKRLVGPGEYGIPVSDDEVTVLGDKIDLMILAARPKAMDFTDQKNIIVNFDHNSEIFQDIAERADEKVEGTNPCVYGVSFLVFERSTAGYLEYYCRTKSARAECNKLEPFLKSLKPVTIGSRVKEAEDFSWHIMTVHKCSQPFTNLPPQEEIEEQITKFLSEKSTDVEASKEEAETSDRVR